MPCTSLCSIGRQVDAPMSPCTRIIGGRPADRCRSDALFLTTKASSSEISIYNCSMLSDAPGETATDRVGAIRRRLPAFTPAPNYVHNREQLASRARAYRGSGTGRPGARPARSALLAVSKTFAAAEVRAAYAAGQREFGENYVQEALDKMSRSVRSASCLAFHRPAPEQQDARDRRTFRLGAFGRAREDRAAPGRQRGRRAGSARMSAFR